MRQMQLAGSRGRALLALAVLVLPFLWMFRGIANGETYAETWDLASDPIFAEARDFPRQTRWIGDHSAGYLNRSADHAISRDLRRGALPLWNPHQALGAPLHGTHQSMALSPLRMLTVTLPGPSDMAVSIYLVLQALLGAFGTYLWLRSCGIGRAPAVLGAFLFVMSGTTFSMLRFSGPTVVALEPWMLFAIERVLRAPGLRTALFAGVMTGLVHYAGHPTFIVVGLGVAGLYGLVRLAQVVRLDMANGSTALARRRAGWLVLGGVIGIAIGAGGWWPFVELLRISWNPKIEHPLPAWIPPLPDILDHTRDMDRLYVAAFFWPLAAAGAWARGPGRLAALGIVLLGLCMTYDWPIPFHGHVLTDSLLTSYTVHVIVLGGCALAAQLLSRPRWSRPAAIGAALSALAVAFVFYEPTRLFPEFWGYAEARTDRPMFAALAAAVVVVAAVFRFVRPRLVSPEPFIAAAAVLVALAELLPHAEREVYPEPAFYPVPETHALAALRRLVQPGERVVGVGSDSGPMVMRPNIADLVGVDDVRASAPIFVERSHRLLARANGWYGYPTHILFPRLPPPQLGVGSSGLDVLGVRWVLTVPWQAVSPGMVRAYQDRFVAIDENPTAFPRAWLVHAAVRAAGEEEALREVERLDLRRVVVLEGTAPRVGARPPTSAPRGESVRQLSRTSDRVELAVVAARPGYLVLSDSYYPGWRATVDGESVEIHPANVALRAVFVPAGRHRVTFTYRPILTYFGLVLGLLGLLAWIAVEVRELVRKRRAVAPAPPGAIRSGRRT